MFASRVENELRKELESAGVRQGWLDAPGILAAVSGGGDSMALLSLLLRFFKGRVVAAHLEHGLRGEASIADAEFVREYCGRIGIECFVKHCDVAGEAKKGESAEMAGRRMRYEFFGGLMESVGLQYVATGHTADDTVETMLLNLFRGAGMLGLSGIRERRDGIVRPLINCFRKDLRTYLRESAIPWREDETNQENSYQRNKIRNQLIPWLRSNMNASVDRTLLGLAGELREKVASVGTRAMSLLRLVTRPHKTALAVWDTASARGLDRLSLLDIIREQGSRLDLPTLDRKRADELAGLILSSDRWRFQWAGDVEVCGSSDLTGWIHRRALTPPDAAELCLRLGEHASLRWGKWRINLDLRDLSDRRGCHNPGGKDPEWRALLPSSGEPTLVSLKSAGESDAKKHFLPWWDAFGRPFISWKCENFNGSWLPGVLSGMRVESSCAIIAYVFVEP
ncbi:MAG: tRNA lysidine(34) synthetase TilS [Synergistaceae bacterium]|jgi:tRNA(Ile)-lysidine synthase|nr:tRNA lysidine(34) synthetase TilS [Synergistaceae bacterium]